MKALDTPNAHTPWNKRKLAGQRPPLKLQEVWAIRIRLQLSGNRRDLALINLLPDARRDRNIKQSHLALGLNRPQSYASKYETGERRLDFVDVYLICEQLSLPFSEFSRIYEEKIKHLLSLEQPFALDRK